MEQCHKAGLTKSIGVCSFSSEMLQSLLDSAEIPPAANQMGMQLFLTEKGLRQICMDNRISMIVTSTIGATQGHLDYTEFAAIVKGMEKISKDEQETTEEDVHRWAYGQGASLLLESFSEEHMQKLLNIFH